MIYMTKKDKDNKTVPIEAMERLAQIMNDSPTIIKLGGKEYSITALKPGTQWMIAEEAVKIQKKEDASYSDVISQFAKNVPSVIRVLTLAILNDRERINSDEYRQLYETIQWETDPKEWVSVLVDIMNMLSLDFFFDTTSAIAAMRRMALERKMTREEQRLSLAAQNGGK